MITAVVDDHDDAAAAALVAGKSPSARSKLTTKEKKIFLISFITFSYFI